MKRTMLSFVFLSFRTCDCADGSTNGCVVAHRHEQFVRLRRLETRLDQPTHNVAVERRSYVRQFVGGGTARVDGDDERQTDAVSDTEQRAVVRQCALHDVAESHDVARIGVL